MLLVDRILSRHRCFGLFVHVCQILASLRLPVLYWRQSAPEMQVLVIRYSAPLYSTSTSLLRGWDTLSQVLSCPFPSMQSLTSSCSGQTQTPDLGMIASKCFVSHIASSHWPSPGLRDGFSCHRQCRVGVGATPLQGHAVISCLACR